MEAIRDINQQEHGEKIRKCCRRRPEIFRDTKIGRLEEMWIVACSDCGSFADHPVREQALWLWEQGVTSKNPPDLEFIARLNKEHRAIERGKRG